MKGRALFFLFLAAACLVLAAWLDRSAWSFLLGGAFAISVRGFIQHT